MDRGDSGDTVDSPFGSALATPIDEDTPHAFDRLGEYLNKNQVEDVYGTPNASLIHKRNLHFNMTRNDSDSGSATPMPKLRQQTQPISLSRAVNKAKKLAKSLVPGQRVRCLCWRVV
jgi:hypothetical protein